LRACLAITSTSSLPSTPTWADTQRKSQIPLSVSPYTSTAKSHAIHLVCSETQINLRSQRRWLPCLASPPSITLQPRMWPGTPLCKQIE
jgi:hypothetical protein